MRYPALVELVRRHALEFGDFTLKSGAKSTFYIDLRRLTLSRHLGKLSQLLFSQTQFWYPATRADVVGGPSLGADPLVAGLIMEAHYRGRQLDGFLVRPAAKDHGTGRRVEGTNPHGRRALILEDVVTSGASLIDAVLVARSAGADVVAALAVLDRTGEAGPQLARLGVPYQSLLTLADVLSPRELAAAGLTAPAAPG